MAIRRILFPEATVSQTASYCLTAGLWCRAQTLSPTPSTPPPLPFLSFYPSLLCWFWELLFLSEDVNDVTEGKETREIEGEAHRETERSGRGKLWFFWSWDRCYQHVSALHTASKKGGLYWFAPIFQSKKWVPNLRFSSVLLQIISLSTNKEINVWRQA